MIKHTIIVTVITALLIATALSLAGCSQTDLEIGARLSSRNLQEHEGADSRHGWGLGAH